MRKKDKGAPFSLFAFQDAITSVCGVVVLVTLILSLMLTRMLENDAREIDNAETAKKLEAQIKETREKIELAKVPTPASKFCEEAVGLTMAEVESRLEEAKDNLADAKEEKLRANQRKEKAENREKKAEKTKVENEKIKKEIEKTEKAEKAIRDAIGKDEKNVTYQFPNSGEQAPWYVDISAESISATSRGERRVFKDSDEFVAWALTRPSSSEYFVLIARPSGVDAYSDIYSRLSELDIDVGLDFVGESRVLDFLPADEEENNESK